MKYQVSLLAEGFCELNNYLAFYFQNSIALKKLSAIQGSETASLQHTKSYVDCKYLFVINQTLNFLSTDGNSVQYKSKISTQDHSEIHIIGSSEPALQTRRPWLGQPYFGSPTYLLCSAARSLGHGEQCKKAAFTGAAFYIIVVLWRLDCASSLRCPDPLNFSIRDVKSLTVFAYRDKCNIKRVKETDPTVFLTLFIVGETGFEPATLWSQTRCATGLRHSPRKTNPIFINIKLKVST